MIESFCADLSAAAGEPIAATAPRTDHWLLLEARGLWESEALDSPGVPAAAREAAAAWLAATPNGRVVLIRQPVRRDVPGAFAFLVDARAGHERIERRELASLEELGEVLVPGALGGPDGAGAAGGPGTLGGAVVDGPLHLVCTHGKRDACCARIGLKVVAALEACVPPEQVWQCSHIGGHRFAGNIVWLPHGVYLGRVAPEDVPGVAAALQAGRIPLAHLRGRASLPPAAQAADCELRGRLGLDGVGAVALAGLEEEPPAGALVRLAASGAEHRVRVTREPAPPVLVSCGGEPEPQQRHRAVPA